MTPNGNGSDTPSKHLSKNQQFRPQSRNSRSCDRGNANANDNANAKGNGNSNTNDSNSSMGDNAARDDEKMISNTRTGFFLDDDIFEDALLVADFLTTYHSNYVTDDEKDGDDDNDGDDNGTLNRDKNGNPKNASSSSYFKKSKLISPWDLVSAIQYRSDMQSHADIQSLIHNMTLSSQTTTSPSNQNKTINNDTEMVITKLKSILSRQKQKIWTNKQNRISKDLHRLSSDEDTLRTIENYQVWTTKLIASDVLLYHPSTSQNGGRGGSHKRRYPSCSTLLNMASGNYFSQVMPSCQVELHDTHHKTKGENTKKKNGNINNGVQNQNVERPSSSSRSPSSKISNADMKYRGTLAIPPNSLTWREYLRLSIMVSSLSSLSSTSSSSRERQQKNYQQASKSTMTQSIYTNPEEGFSTVNCTATTTDQQQQQQQPEKQATTLKMSAKHSFEMLPKHKPADLVALWVRAQRNTCAYLHMIDLFAVEKVLKDEKKKEDQEVDQDLPMDDQYQYVAKYIGNFKKAKNQIEKEAVLVNKLTTWAVINQVQFTHERMRNDVFDEMQNLFVRDLKSSRSINNNNKKRIHDNNYGKANGKRRKYQHGDNDKKSRREKRLPTIMNDVKVKQAMKVFILRLFATRNRNLLKIVYSSHDDENGNSYISTTDNYSTIQNVPEKVKQYLKVYCNKSTDRTLARIDRRIMFDKYEEENAFEDAILSLLTALRYALPSDNESLMEELLFAERDFQYLCNELLMKHDDIDDDNDCDCDDNEPSPLLKNFDLTDANIFSEQLLSLPTPWIDKNTVVGHQNGDNGSTTRSLEECAMLSSLYWSPALVEHLKDRPDFTEGGHVIEWEEVKIDMKRDSVDETWGIFLYIAEHCSTSLRETESWLDDGNDILPLLQKVRDPPLRVPYTGMIAYSVNEGMAAGKNGLKPGDVITAAYVNDTKYVFGEMNELEMMQVFKSEAMSLNLTIYRPATDILEKSAMFQTGVKSIIKRIEETHNYCLQHQWPCEKRLEGGFTVPEHKTDNRNSILHEAKLCKALISRLSLEWCSLPFHDEEIIIGDEANEEEGQHLLHSSHSSLRRLYSMMNYIIAESLNQPLPPHSSPFELPPWTKSQKETKREYLLWANGLKTKPFLLLCKGIDCMTKFKSSHKTSKKFNLQQDLRLKELFVKLFVRWCLDDDRYELEPQAFTVIEPWVSPACSICKVRQAEPYSYSGCCDSERCMRILQQRLNDMDGNFNEHQVNIGTFINHPSIDQVQYDFHSSFVGRSILILPNDPLLDSFEQKANFALERSHGPFQLLVVSFVPSFFITEELHSGIVQEEIDDDVSMPDEDAEDGIYYLIPIISTPQLNYILQFCEMRNNSKADSSWIDQDIWSICGIFAMTTSQLQRRMESSKLITGAIENTITNASKVPLESKDEMDNSNSGYANAIDLFDENHCDDDPVSMLSALSKNEAQMNKFELTCQTKQLVILNETLFVDQKLFHPVSSLQRCYLFHEEDISHLNNNKMLGASKMDKVASPSSLDVRFLQGLIFFRDDEAVRNNLCKLCYSDLLYWEFRNVRRGFWTKKRSNAMKQMEEIVCQQTLQSPLARRKSGQAQSMQLLLHRLDLTEESLDDSESEYEEDMPKVKYEGVGWGLELVQWNGEESTYRVGRIAPDSPAEQAGFLTDDIIVSINGVSTTEIKCMHSLCRHILGKRVENKLQSKNTEYPYVVTLSGLRKPVLGPIFVELHREEFVSPTSLDTAHEMVSPGRNRQILNPPVQSELAAQIHDVQRPSIERRVISRSPNLDTNKQPLNRDGSLSHYTIQNPLNNSSNHNSSDRMIFTNDARLNAEVIDHAIVNNPTEVQQQNVTSNATDSTLSRFSNYLKSLGPNRVLLDESHLYQSGPHKLIFTMVEISIFLAALEKSQPILGSRLLYPRYRKSIILNEYISKIGPLLQKKQSKAIEMIPKLSEDQWMVLLRADWERSLEEVGEVIDREGAYEYKEATKVLPIDRLFEGYFRDWRSGLNTDTGNILLRMTNEIYGQNIYPDHNHMSPMSPPHMHHQGTYMPHSSWELHTNHQQNNPHTNYPPDPTPRIRGGWDDQSDYISQKLSNLSHTEWSGLPIFGGCTVTRDGVRSIDVCLGRVLNTDSLDHSKVDVRIIFVSSHGRLDRTCIMDASSIFIIPTLGKNSSDDDIVAKYTEEEEKINSFISALHIPGKGVTATKSPSSRSPAKENKQAELEQYNKISPRSHSHPNEKCKDHLISCTLGYLPDNRIVHWFSCDPTAIYLRNENDDISYPLTLKKYSNNVKKFSEMIRWKKKGISFNLLPSNESSHVCIWGCSQAVKGDSRNRTLLGFETEKDMKDHLKQHHSYEASSTSANWERVSEGSAIKELCVDLTSHLCSISWLISKFGGPKVSDNGDKTKFDKSPFGKRFSLNTEKVLNIFQNREYLKFASLGLIDNDTHNLMRLLSRVFQLFSIETNGAFRKNDVLVQSNHALTENVFEDNGEVGELSLIDHLEKDILASADNTNDTQKCNGIATYKFATMDPNLQMNCDLCRTNNEHVLTSFVEDKPNTHGIGCALLTDLYGYERRRTKINQRLQQALQSLASQSGRLNETKMLVIKVAANVPHTLYKEDTFDIWNQSRLDSWIRFLLRCINFRMLSQAYLMLLISIDTNKMPLWWKSSKAGWASTFTTMQIHSLSGLALHLYVFDAAIASSDIFSTKDFGSKGQDEDTMDCDNDTSIPETVEITKPVNVQTIPSYESTHRDDVVVTDNEMTNNEQASNDNDSYHEEEEEDARKATSLSLQLKMKQVLRWVDEEGVSRYKGAPNEKCLRCEKRGKVEQCEICPNVVHKACVGSTSSDLKLVCDTCINFWHAKKQDAARHAMTRMKQVIKWSETDGLQRYDGDHNDNCMYCDEEGQVLLCEFCSSVVHQECIGYQGSIDDIDFVCDHCVEEWYQRKNKSLTGPHYITCGEMPVFSNSKPLIVKCKLFEEQEKKTILEDNDDDKDGVPVISQVVLCDDDSLSLLDMAEEDNITPLYKDRDGKSMESSKESNDKSGISRFLQGEITQLPSDHSSRCKLLLSYSDKDKVKQIIKWGDETLIPRKPEHEHNNYCVKCGNDQGLSDWYNCQFCENVVHSECCGLSGDFEDAEFVCNECIVDILQALKDCTI